MPLATDNPEARADRLLRDVLGDDQYRRLRSVGYLDLPSRRCAGRVYRIDNLGNLSYREPWEATFSTSLCVQPVESIPRDDQTAMRYLLVTADEERLLKTANPLTFGFAPLVRSLFHDFRQRYPAWLAVTFTALALLFFLGSLAGLFQAAGELWVHHSSVALVRLLVLLAPGLIGGVLVFAGIAELQRSLRSWRARRRYDHILAET